MKEIIQAIGSVITSPYPYFAIFGYFGLQSYLGLIGQQLTTQQVILFGLLLLFLAFLCVLVFVLIQKVGHSAMLSPEHQIALERLKLLRENRDQAKKELIELVERETSND